VRKVTCADVEAEVIRYYGGLNLRDPSRTPEFVDARRLAYQAMRYFGYSFSEIGRHFAKDHSTIMHHCKRPVSDESLDAVVSATRAAVMVESFG
jgi:chromosomal replication initiation ATPase DnaA